MTVYSSNFRGPLRSGDTRSPAPTVSVGGSGVSVGGSRGGVTFGPSGATITSTNPITGKTTSRSYGGGGGGGGGTSTPTINKVIPEITQLEPINLKPEVKIEKTSETLGLGKIQEVNLNLGTFPKTEIMNRETIKNIQPTKSTKTFLINEYYSKGYTPYQSKILEKTSGFKGLNYSKEKAMEVVVDYEKKHMPSSIYSLVSGEGTSGETMEQYKERMGKADIAWGENVTYGELQKKGDYPTIVRKGFSDLGTKYFGLISDVTTNVTGNKKLSEERKKEGGRILGEAALWGFFSPEMKTGTYSQQELSSSTEEEIYDYVEGVWKKRNKLTGQITRKQATSSFGELSEERKINVLKQAFSNERDSLGNVVQKVYLDKVSLIKDINKAKNFMRESGLKTEEINKLINKLFPNIEINIPIINQEGGIIPKQISKNRFNLLTGYNIQETSIKYDIPQMNNIFGITGFTTNDYSSLTKQKSNQKTNNIIKQNSFVDVMLGTSVSVITKQKTKQRGGIAPAQTFIDIMITKQEPRQVPKQTYYFPEPQVHKKPYPPYTPKPLPIPYFKPFIWIPKKPKTSWSWAWPTRSTKGKPGKRAYQSSLGAYQLGIFAGKKYPKGKQQTGLSIRPIVYNKESSNSYSKRINKLLIGGY